METKSMRGLVFAVVSSISLWPLALSPAVAASTDTATVTITVQPGVNKSLTVQLIGGTTSFDLGLIDLGSLRSGTTAFLVTNNGNISESFVLQISSESDPNPGAGIAAPGYPWSSIDVSGGTVLVGLTDRYQLFAQFNSTDTAPPGFSTSDTFLVKKTARLATSGQFAGIDRTGANVSAVPGSNTRGLFFAVKTSDYSTTGSQKHISVTVSGQ